MSKFLCSGTVVYLLTFFLNETGIQDLVTGMYVTNPLLGSRTIYYKGTRIEYKNDKPQYADSIVVDGPTKVPLRVSVRRYFAN